MTNQHRTCRCGAIYRRTESMASSREVNRFECTACGASLENWNSAWVPSYRLIVGPTISAVADTGTFESSVRSFGTNKEE
jgi:hypothetical protein